MRRVILVLGGLLFASSLFLVVTATKETRYTIIEIEGGEIPHRMSSKRSKLFGDIVYAYNTFLSFDSDKLGRIEVQAERSVYNIKSGVIELTGNVKVKAKNLYAETRRAKLFVENNSISKIESYEKVKVETDGKTIRSERADIFPRERLIIFSGDPRIYQRGLEIQGKIIKVFLDSDVVEIDGMKAKTESE